MEWRLNNAEENTIICFSEYIVKNKSMLMEKEIMIFGASVRGTLLGMLLEKEKIDNFSYIDNDERKWKDTICNYKISSVSTLSDRVKGEFIVLIPLEYYEDAVLQLEGMALRDGVDFAVLKDDVYEDYATEFQRKTSNERLAIGESFLVGVPIYGDRLSVRRELYNIYGEKIKVLGMSCMGMRGFFHILKLLCEKIGCPQKISLYINFETFRKSHDVLPRTQHPRLLKLIASNYSSLPEEFEKYIEYAEEMSHNYKIEIGNSPVRTTKKEMNEKEDDITEEIRSVLLNRLTFENTEVSYFEKFLLFCQRCNIVLTVVVVPINMQLVKEQCSEKALEIIEENCNFIKKLAGKYGANYLDLSHVLEDKYFIKEVTVNDAIIADGVKIIGNLIEDGWK